MSREVSSCSDIITTDIAIIGGGNAGITLASKLNYHNTVVLEPKTPEERDVSWALWVQRNQQNKLAKAAQGSWDQWRLIDHNREILHKSNQYLYTSLSSAAFLQRCEDKLPSSNTLIRDFAENIVSDGPGGHFTVSGQKYSAKYIYDSRPPKMAETGLKQHFLGIEISTKETIKDSHIATLMDFRVDQSRGLHFIYALPLSDRKLLIESTMISETLEPQAWYQKAIYRWLSKQSIDIDKVIREENGVIPMHDAVPLDNSLASIGSASGAVRLSSGYAFTNIQAQITQLAEGINRGDFKVPQAISSHLTQLDKIFNGVLLSEPSLGVSLMMQTAGALNADAFARFMLGKATVFDWTKVILAMPKIPFIKQVLR